MNERRLGATDIHITPIGLGCWQFSNGGGIVGGYWPALPQETANAIVAASLEGGINWFDTAEIYGKGGSERALSQALCAAGKSPGEVIVATKWWPTARPADSIRTTIDERLRFLDPFGIDLHQVHQPFAFATVAAQMNAMADLVEAKKIRAAGVSNFSASRMRRAHAALRKRGLALASNQMLYNLLDRRIERTGVMAAAKELGITIIAYSPLAQGILSGKFHDDPSRIETAGMRKYRGDFRKSGLARSKALVDELRAIANAHGVTASQVALAWTISFHGDTLVAIPGATKPHHVGDLTASMQLKLTDLEMQRIDESSRQFV